jgi:hypothetical protein
MKNNVILGVLAVIIVGAGAYMLMQPKAVTAPALVEEEVVASTTVQTPVTPAVDKKSQPTFSVGPTTKTVTSAVASFDKSTITTTDSYPTITGTANVPEVGIIINNSKGEGLVGTGEITVENGHWSYSTSVMLPPGTYIVMLYGGAKVVNAQLTVSP